MICPFLLHLLGDIDQADSFVKSSIDRFPDELLKLSPAILAVGRVGLTHFVSVKRGCVEDG